VSQRHTRGASRLDAILCYSVDEILMPFGLAHSNPCKDEHPVVPQYLCGNHFWDFTAWIFVESREVFRNDSFFLALYSA
jgi:hypothetical protein